MHQEDLCSALVRLLSAKKIHKCLFTSGLRLRLAGSARRNASKTTHVSDGCESRPQYKREWELVVPSGREERRGDTRDALAQEVTDDPKRVEGALATGAENRHE